MAVENKFFDSNLEAGTLADGALFGGSSKSLRIEGAIAAADDDGSKYGIIKVNSSAVIQKIEYSHTAITGGTDYDIGLYNVDANGDLGSVVDADIFADGVSLATAAKFSDGLTTLPVASMNSTVGELAGETSNSGKQYAIVLTGNTVGTAAGTFVADVKILTN